MGNVYITDYLERNAQQYQDKTALLFEGHSFTWRELNTSVSNASSNLRTVLHNDKQHIIGILLSNSWQFIVNYLAILHAGHIALPLDPTFKKLEIDGVIEQIKPEMVISDESFMTMSSANTRWVHEDTIRRYVAPRYDVFRSNPTHQVATLLFTSGTTGRPKAVPYTHANYLWNIQASTQIWSWTSRDTMLLSLPLSHWYALAMGLHGVLVHGNTLDLQRRFDAVATLQRLSKGDISIFTHVAPVYSALLKAADTADYDLSAVRLCISGGAPLPPSIWRAFKQRFGVEIIEAYGSSETGRIASNTLYDRVPGTPGRPLPGVEAKLGPKNELLVRSPGLFPGYWHNAAATNEKLTQGGWWHTGDIVEFRDGRIHHKGRTQERILKRGYSISPRDIEWALLHSSDIREAQVIGLQSEGNADDRLVYFLVTSANKDSIIDFCNANMPASWRPDEIFIVDALPRTRNGKVSIAALRELLHKQL